MKRIVTLLAPMLLFVGHSFAQNVANYIFTAFPGTYTNVTGGTAVTNIQVDDGYTTNIPIGFQFQLSGVNYTTVSPSSNGWLSLGTPAGNYLTNDLANLANIVPAFMPLWDDVGGQSGQAFYQTTGAAPNRVFTFEWRNWNWNYAGSPAVSFQVKLFESTNVIQYIYRQETGAVNNPSATIALARTVTDYQSLPSTTANPIPSTTTFNTSLSAKPATDQVYQWAPPPPCTGQPTAGIASLAGGCPSSLLLTGYTPASSLSFQWQRRVCGGTWNDISNSNAYYYNLSSITGPTEFRAYIVCLNSGLVDTSNIITVTSLAPCYCTSMATSTADEEIYSVTINGVTNASSCTIPAPGPGSILNRYSNFTTLGPMTTLTPGATVPFTIVEDECDGPFYYSNGIAMWIDFNGDGDYTDLGEQVYSESTTSPSPRTVTGSFTVPANATTGIVTGMRVSVVEGSSGGSLTPCLSYGWGETEDYLVQIAYVPIIVGGGVYCAGDSAVITASAPGLANPKFLWTGPNGQFIDTTASIFFPNIQPSSNGNYTLYVLSYPCGGGGIADTTAKRIVNVYVNPRPVKPIVAPIITFCQGDVFNGIPIFGQNLKWYSVPTGGIPSIFPPVINTSQFGSATYYVSQTVNNCEGPRAQLTINVVAKPAPPVVTSPVRYCQGDVASPLEALGQNIRWYSVPTGGVGTPVTPTPGTNAQGTFTWYASQTVAGCESDRVPVEVSVSYKPNALITISRPYVCQYDTITLTYFGNALTTADYIWTLPTGATIVSGSEQGPLVVRFDSAGIKTVKLTVDNAGCVGPEARINIPVRQSPLFSIDMTTDACKDEIVNIAVNYATTGIDNYNWNGFGGGEMVYGALTAGPYGVRWSTPGVKVIEVVATDEICKSLPVFDTITIHELPDATITANTENICAGDTVEFRGVYNAENSYQWEPFQYFGSSHSHIDTGIVDFTTYVKLTVTSRFNCRATDSVLINAKPCCEIYFPNAFTPNNDGRNDLFRPVTVGTHEISAFRVLNRWGQVIYESRNERGGWDGSFNGKPQDMGTYFYHIKYKCADGNYYEDKGEVTLVR